MKRTYAGNFIRSAIAPEMTAGVITANMHWNAMKAIWGTRPVASLTKYGLTSEGPIPESIALRKSPRIPGTSSLGLKARL